MRQANVLIVDRDPLTRQGLKTQVIDLGHRVVGEADNSSQALTMTRNLRPDVVLLALALSSSSGPEVAQSIYSERLAAVIFVAATEDTALLDSLETCNVSGFLSLPVRSADLRVLIPLAIARYQERNTLEEEIKSLNDRMEARKLVGRAKAILMERHGLSERDAFKRIQSQSIALGKQAHEIAQAIITASEITLGGSSTAGTANSSSETTETRLPLSRPPRGEKSSLDAL